MKLPDERLLVQAVPDLLHGWVGSIFVRRGFQGEILIPGVWLDWRADDVALLDYEAVDPREGVAITETRDDVPVSSVLLDFSISACRDRALYVIADLSFLEDEGALRWHRTRGRMWYGRRRIIVEHRAEDDPFRVVPGRRHWTLYSASFAECHFVAPGEPIPVRGASGYHPDEDPKGAISDPDYRVVEGLAAIDPNDDTLLEDGSRRADALALAVVARELL